MCLCDESHGERAAEIEETCSGSSIVILVKLESTEQLKLASRILEELCILDCKL